jgi:hypothetical protein
MKKTVLTYDVGTRIISFSVFHNLETLGFDIKLAFKSWLTRRKTLTAEMFCRYISQRSDGFICLTESEYEFLKQTI